MGYYQPDDGEILLDGRQRKIDNPREAHALGLGMVYQHFTLVPAMTVPRTWCWRATICPRSSTGGARREALEAFLDTHAVPGPARPPVSRSRAGEKQKGEILKQLYLRPALPDPRRADLGAHADEADEVLGMLARHGRRAASSPS